MKKIGLINSTVIYALSSLATSAIPFLLLPVLTRYLTPAEYGMVVMFTIYVSILSVFVGLSVQGAISVRFFDRERFNIQEYVSSCIFILLSSTAIVLSFVLVTRSLLEKYISLPSEWLLAGVFVAGMQFVVLVRLSLWQVAKHPLKYGVLQITQSAINAGLSLWLVVVVGLAWEGRLIAIFMSTLIVLIAVLLSLWQDGYVKFKVNVIYVKDALKFGIPLIPHVLGGMLLVTTDRVLITNILGIDQAGIYTVALQIGMVLSIGTTAVNQAYAPWLYEQLKISDDQRKRQIVRYTYLYFLAVTAVALLMGVFASGLLGVIAGDKFQEAEGAIAYIAMAFAFGGMYFMVTNYVFYERATGKLALNTIVVGLINVVLTFVLVRYNGIIGAAQSFMISQALLFLGTWRLSSRLHPMPWLRCFKKASNETKD